MTNTRNGKGLSATADDSFVSPIRFRQRSGEGDPCDFRDFMPNWPRLTSDWSYSFEHPSVFGPDKSNSGEGHHPVLGGIALEQGNWLVFPTRSRLTSKSYGTFSTYGVNHSGINAVFALFPRTTILTKNKKAQGMFPSSTLSTRFEDMPILPRSNSDFHSLPTLMAGSFKEQPGFAFRDSLYPAFAVTVLLLPFNENHNTDFARNVKRELKKDNRDRFSATCPSGFSGPHH